MAVRNPSLSMIFRFKCNGIPPARTLLRLELAPLALRALFSSLPPDLPSPLDCVISSDDMCVNANTAIQEDSVLCPVEDVP